MAALKNDGSVWIYGYNLTLSKPGHKEFINNPIKIKGLSDIIDIAVGSKSLFALKKDGTVWVYGYDMIDDSNKFYPRKIEILEGFIKDINISSNNQIVALRSDGRVYAWNFEFTMNGDFLKVFYMAKPVLLNIQDVKQLYGKGPSTIFIKNNGEMRIMNNESVTDNNPREIKLRKLIPPTNTIGFVNGSGVYETYALVYWILSDGKVIEVDVHKNTVPFLKDFFY